MNNVVSLAPKTSLQRLRDAVKALNKSWTGETYKEIKAAIRCVAEMNERPRDTENGGDAQVVKWCLAHETMHRIVQRLAEDYIKAGDFSDLRMRQYSDGKCAEIADLQTAQAVLFNRILDIDT